MEIALVERFGWSVREIDETDIVSLLTFVRIYLSKHKKQAVDKEKTVYCDQVSWL